ncbi:MAG: VWA domain-containing protein [Halolamina sp.]
MIDLAASKKLSGADRERVPFPAVVGQEGLKEALLAVGANDALDGLLVRGEKGTAKSTAARALAGLLPEQRAVADCPYGCPPDDPERQCADCRARSDPPVETRSAPFVTLPLGAARERVVGSLSVSSALDGETEFNPGLLARANRGVLYVDEVNLLDDHLVDVLLDAAASGVNKVEQDGVSLEHPASFTLVGTMNPEEGSLRPQFRDRFALQVAVSGAEDLDDRVAVVQRALSGFEGEFAEETAAVRDRLHDAREHLSDVTIPDSLLYEITELCRDAGVEGHRADIATGRAARTLAALDGRDRVVEPDVRRAAELALPHRLKSRPFDDAPDAEELLDERFGGEAGEESEGNQEDATEPEEAGEDEDDGRSEADDRDDPSEGDGDPGEEEPADNDAEGQDSATPAPTPNDGDQSGERDGRSSGAGSAEAEQSGDGESEADGNVGSDDADDEATPRVPGTAAEPVDPGAGASPDLEPPTAEASVGGQRAVAAPSTDGRGGRVRTEQATTGDSVDAAASARAAAMRGGDGVASRDLRKSVRAARSSSLVVFAVDASASMRGPMRAAKAVALDLLRDAYEQRDEVAVVTFAGEGADVVLPPTASVDRAARHLKSLPTGDRTPLSAGLRATDDLLARAEPDSAMVVVVTDGRGNAGGETPVAAAREAASALRDRGAELLVVDAGDADDRASLVPDLVTAADGERIPLERLTPDYVAEALGGEQ